MKKASEYRRHAAECRQLATLMDGDHREQLLDMATTWEQLAEDRGRLLPRDPSDPEDVDQAAADTHPPRTHDRR